MQSHTKEGHDIRTNVGVVILLIVSVIAFAMLFFRVVNR